MTAAVLLAGLLGSGVNPALAGGTPGDLILTLTGNGSMSVTGGPNNEIACLRGGGLTFGTCEWAFSVDLYPTITLTVRAAVGTAFCDNDACYAEAATTLVVINTNGSLDWAGFAGLQNRYLKVLKSGVGSGSVTSSDGKISCPASCHETALVGYTFADPVTLHAVPASGSAFDGWTGACAGQGATCYILLSDPTLEMSTTAAFKLNPAATPGATRTPAPTHSTAPGQTAPAVTTGPDASPTAGDPGASPHDTTPSPSASSAGAQPSASAAATTPASTTGSVDTGWIAFLVLLVLVIGASIGGGIAFLAMRRRSPPPST